MAVKETVVDAEFIERMQQYRKPSSTSLTLFEGAEENPIIFAERLLGFKLYAWQIDFLWKYKLLIEGKLTDEETEEFKDELAAITSRQIGKSFCLGVAAIWSCSFNKYPATAFHNTVIGMISASDRQAKELLREVRKIINNGDRHMREKYQKIDFFSSLIDKTEQNNTEIITFKSGDKSPHPEFLKGSRAGSQIMSYPPTQKVLGKSFTLIFGDELGRNDQIPDDFIKDELMPTGSATQAKKVWTSTPWGPTGYFYRIVDPDGIFGSSPAVVVKYSIEALSVEEHAQGQYEYVKKHIAQLRKDGDYGTVQRAYYCEFVKGERNFFDPGAVDSLFDKNYEMFDTFDGLVDIGIDFGGKVSSQTVITISTLNEQGDIFRLYTRVYPVGEDDSLISDLEDDIMKKFPNWQRLIIDDAPVATYLEREMLDKGWEMHPMSFRSDKVKKFGAFRAKLNRGEIFSFNDDALRQEMKELETNTGSRQSRIVAPRGGSDDLVDSFIMSTYFMVEEDSDTFVPTMGDWDEVKAYEW